MIPQITEVRVRHYKSIDQARVSLQPFTALVGPNGSGKSNFVDSLAFVQESLSESVELAFKNRGGIAAVRRKSTGHPTHIGLGLSIRLPDHGRAEYGFEIAAKKERQFSIAKERCTVWPFMGNAISFDVQNGTFRKEIPGIRAKVAPDRLALFAASATEEFRPVFDFLSSMRFYSVLPFRLRELQDPDAGLYLKRDGSNAAAVLKRLQTDSASNGKYERICNLLSKIVDGLARVEHRSVGQKETLRFKQEVGTKNPWTFDALNMSDGTLRALGLLLAVYQPGNPSVIAVEEPEATVHPAVMEAIVDVLTDASRERQVLVTTHSPDILDQKELTDEQIKVFAVERNRTHICPLAESSRQAVRENLYTPGELLRADELNPDEEAAEANAEQFNLFAAEDRRGEDEG